MSGFAEEHDLLWPEHLAGLPFEGATLAKLRLVRATLRGYPVEYQTVARRADGRPPERGVFSDILLPGDWGSAAAMVTDITIATSWYGDTCCGGGVSHVLGLGSIVSLEVLSPDRWGICQRCCCWRPMSLLRQAYTWFEDAEDAALNAETMECHTKTDGGCA